MIYHLGYGFKTDAAMLIASYPIFDRALFSGKTLLDLSFVHNEVRSLIENLISLISGHFL